MRKESSIVDVHTRAQRASERTNGSGKLQHVFDVPKPQGRLRAWIDRHFDFPSGELAILATTGQKISLPTPLLGALVALFIWMAGGTLAGVYLVGRMSATVDNLGNTFTQYQIRAESEKKADSEAYRAEIKRLTEKNDLQDLVIADLREKQIRAEARKN